MKKLEKIIDSIKTSFKVSPINFFGYGFLGATSTFFLLHNGPEIKDIPSLSIMGFAMFMNTMNLVRERRAYNKVAEMINKHGFRFIVDEPMLRDYAEIYAKLNNQEEEFKLAVNGYSDS